MEIMQITAVNLRHNTFPHLLAAIGLAVVIPVLSGVSSLNSIQSAQPLEKLLSIAGIILLTPIFVPEQDKNIRDLIRSKKADYTVVCIIRLIYSLILLALIFGAFSVVMYKNECDITLRHFYGGYISAVFLGTIGFLFSGVGGNSIVGYMVSFVYYIVNFFIKDELGVFYLFSMSSGCFNEKIHMMAASVLLLLLTLMIVYIKDSFF